MAKGNLLLGTAANSVGDVVMYRREGAQVSRVRVRKVKNPKTSAQSTQRAFFAPVAKFYSPLALVLERSFEGLSKAKSYAKFLKTNVDLARTNDWLLPKGTAFFPLPYKLSQGSIAPIAASFSSSAVIFDTFPTGECSTLKDLSDAFVEQGYQNGDVVTVISICKDTEGNYIPASTQIVINTDAGAEYFPSKVGKAVLAYEAKFRLTCTETGFTLAAGAMIVSRFENNIWRRSTQTLVVNTEVMTTIGSDEFKKAAIASYGNTNTGENPLVYLDGDTYVAPAHVEPEP